jgi:site-specific recombinase XerD
MERRTLTLERLSELHAAAYRAENKSERTVEWHTVAIARYAKWLTQVAHVEPTLANFTLDHMREYIAYLRTQPRWADHAGMPEHTRSRPISDETVSWHVRALRAFASWLMYEGHTKENALARLRAPKVPDREVDILSPAEIGLILQTFNHHTEIGSRDLAVFATLLDTGVRAGELVGVRLKDLHLDQGYMTVFGKGKKERPVKLGARAIKSLRFYLTHWRQPARPNLDQVFLTIGHQMGDEEEIFCGAGEPLTVNALQRIIRRIGKRSGVIRLHPHLLRHTFACLYLLQHHDPFALKNLLGHSSLTMTYRYVRAVERLMVVQGSAMSALDFMTLPTIRPEKPGKKKGK